MQINVSTGRLRLFLLLALVAVVGYFLWKDPGTQQQIRSLVEKLSVLFPK